ncbi:hypothetical protein MTR67_025951 [Solanum verrucosum]|uniref:Uncharacterized protein n=1 Tax=Solanum verrucosum TaxID=315347 RepID=A0AAF0QZM4_SOLVR|nr:hypothetical protein MTR67_025951 [Solanum verrucosum]
MRDTYPQLFVDSGTTSFFPSLFLLSFVTRG